MAMFDSLKGVFLPDFISRYQVSYSLIGSLFLSASLAYMVGSYFSGRAIDYFGNGKMMQFAALLAVAGLAVVVFVQSMVGLFVGFVVVSFATACSSMVINSTIPQLDVKNHGLLMNFVHFSYGLGAALTVRLSGALIAAGWQYPSVYSLIFLAFGTMLILSLLVHLPERPAISELDRAFSTIEKQLIALFGMAMGFYVIAELQTGAWLINFAVKRYQLTENDASTYMSLFFLLLSIGRIGGGVIAERYGYLKTVTISLLIGMTLYVSGLLIGLNGLYLLALAGLFFSIAFPTITLALKLYFPNKLSRAMGVIMTISVAMSVLSNFLMGSLSDYFGVYPAMFVMPTVLAISALLLMTIQRRFDSLIDAVRNVDIDQ